MVQLAQTSRPIAEIGVAGMLGLIVLGVALCAAALASLRIELVFFGWTQIKPTFDLGLSASI